jgi:NRAMP (natural resistance-associated macrophage protein)-like metal ion transporter
MAAQSEKYIDKAKNFWHKLGPGLTTGAADDDPSGIATYSQTGAQFGFKFLWLALVTFPLMAVVQEMCARIGMHTGRGLAANIKKHYPRWVLYSCTSLLFVANTLNLGADIGAMAKATQLLIDLPFYLFAVIFGIVTIILQIFTTYEKFAKYLKWLTFVLISYIITAFLIKMDWQQALRSTFIPSLTFSKEAILIICAILGTTISPYLFFWQTAQEVEVDIQNGKTSIKSRQGTSDKEIQNMRVDVWSGMFISNIVMFFIIATTAATLFTNGLHEINTAEQAAQALRPLAGDYAYILFTVGIIGTGLLAVPVLAGSASYALSESFGWKAGLNLKLKQAHNFYGVIILSTLIGLLINFTGINPIKALIYSAVLNGLIAPIILILIVQISSNKQIMGKRTNHPLITLLGWVVIITMVIAGFATIVSLFI